jgi:CRP/FNR family transcriptional regulator, cyclic AMP receptor protein
MTDVHAVGTPWWRSPRKEGGQSVSTKLQETKLQEYELARANVNIVHQRNMTFGQHVADMVASFVGSWLCIGLHTAWFAFWLGFRLDINLLTLIVSLEAIFLCCFILISQNRQSDKDRLAAEADYHTNLAAKVEIETILGRIEAQDIAMIEQHAELLRQTPMLAEILAVLVEDDNDGTVTLNKDEFDLLVKKFKE